VDALLFCPIVDVRRALAAEPGQTRDVLQALRTDSDGRAALAAERALLALTLPMPELRRIRRRKSKRHVRTGRGRNVW